MRGLLLAGCAAVSLGVGGSGWDPQAGAQPQDEALFGVRVGDQLGVGVTTGVPQSSHASGSGLFVKPLRDEMGSTRSDSATPTGLVQVQIGRDAEANFLEVEAGTLRAAEELLAAMMSGCEGGNSLLGDPSNPQRGDAKDVDGNKCHTTGNCEAAYPYLISERFCADDGKDMGDDWKGKWSKEDFSSSWKPHPALTSRNQQKLVCCMKVKGTFRPGGWIDHGVHMSARGAHCTRVISSPTCDSPMEARAATEALRRADGVTMEGCKAKKCDYEAEGEDVQTSTKKEFEDAVANANSQTADALITRLDTELAECNAVKNGHETNKTAVDQTIGDAETRIQNALHALAGSESLAQVEIGPARSDSAASLMQVEAGTLRAAEELLAAMMGGCKGPGLNEAKDIDDPTTPCAETGNCAAAYPYLISKRHCDDVENDKSTKFIGKYSGEDLSGSTWSTAATAATKWKARELENVVCCMKVKDTFRPDGWTTSVVHGKSTFEWLESGQGNTVAEREQMWAEIREKAAEGNEAAKTKHEALTACVSAQKKANTALRSAKDRNDALEAKIRAALNILVWEQERPKTMCARDGGEHSATLLSTIDAADKESCKNACKNTDCKAIDFKESPSTCRLWSKCDDKDLQSTGEAQEWLVVRKS